MSNAALNFVKICVYMHANTNEHEFYSNAIKRKIKEAAASRFILMQQL